MPPILYAVPSFSVSSVVPCEPEEAWRHVTTPSQLNREFAPILRMTFPRSVTTLDPGSVTLGQRLCRSWILLFGLIPVEFDDVVFERIDPPRSFQEASSMALQRTWRHRRSIERHPAGCCIKDDVEFESRIPWAGPCFKALFRALFRYRHFRLGRILGPAHRS